MKKIKNSILLICLVASGILLFQCKKSEEVVIPDPYVIKLATSPTLGSYLTDKNGNTLYFFANDANGANNCTGGCTTAWPNFNATGLVASQLTAGLDLADFNTITTPTGSQTTYKGWPLYYYAPGGVREQAGKTSGEGVGSVWFVAKPDYTIMMANLQLVGLDTKSYVVSATNVYSEGVGTTSYFTDALGRTLYAFAKDSSNINKYTKADFSNNGVWPLYETDKIVVPSILDKTVFSSITVFGKKQLTYKGWPIYYYGPDVDTNGKFRGYNKGVSVPKPNVWPVFYKDYPVSPKKAV